jgi:hypothetical protein
MKPVKLSLATHAGFIKVGDIRLNERTSSNHPTLRELPLLS